MATEATLADVHSKRMSFRATAQSFEKVVAIAKAKGWVNSKGEANVSAVLNHLIDVFDVTVAKVAKVVKAKKKAKKS